MTSNQTSPANISAGPLPVGGCLSSSIVLSSFRAVPSRSCRRHGGSGLWPRRAASGARAAGFPGEALELGDGGHGAGPAGVEGKVGDRLGQFLLAQPVLQRQLEVVAELLDAVQGGQRGDGDQAAISRGQARAFPHVAEQDVVGQLDELGGDAGQALRGGLLRHVVTPCAGSAAEIAEGLAGFRRQPDLPERLHLSDLARAAKPSRSPRRRTQQTVRPSVLRILESMTSTPAFVRNGRLDVLAINPLGRALYSPVFDDPARPANLARF